MNKQQWVIWWSVAVGSMDAMTGLLLVISPARVLGLLDIAVPPADALVFLSWMGVFVAGVGLSYGFVLGDRRRGPSVWMVTALVRVLVGVFVCWRILDGSLVPLWAVVALTDLGVAGGQLAMLRAGWWEEAKR